MLWHWIRRLNRAYHSALVIVVSCFYWLYLLLLESLMQPTHGLPHERYGIYYLVAICALAVRVLNSGAKGQQLLRSDFYSNHGAAFRDVSTAGATILLASLGSDEGSFHLASFPFLFS